MTHPFSKDASLALLLVLWGAPGAQALDIAPPVPLCAIVEHLGHELTTRTGYPAPELCTKVRFALPAAGEADRVQVGEYLPQTGSILLAADIDLTTPWGQSVLLHEMVHAAQHATRPLPDCLASLESEAYSVQAGFLRDAGLDQQAMSTEIFGLLNSHCHMGDPYLH